MLIKTGDSRYRVRTLSSHDVTAATLVIQPLEVAEYPVKFVTLFSVSDELFQYQLDTVIDQETTDDSQDTLDGIIWQRTPPANTSFTAQVNTRVRIYSDTATVRCMRDSILYNSRLGSVQFTYFCIESMCNVHRAL